jgi:hypothetical protein
MARGTATGWHWGWCTQHSSEYLPPELMPSLAACIGADIAVLTRDMATVDIKQRPHVYLAVVQTPDAIMPQAHSTHTGDCSPAGLGSRYGRQGAGTPESPHSGSSCLTDSTTWPASGRHRGRYTAYCHPSGTAVPLGQAG